MKVDRYVLEMYAICYKLCYTLLYFTLKTTAMKVIRKIPKYFLIKSCDLDPDLRQLEMSELFKSSAGLRTYT